MGMKWICVQFLQSQFHKSWVPKLPLFILCVCVFRATPAVYGSFQTRDRMGASAAGLYHNHSNSNARSEPGLGTTLHLVAALDP